MSVLPPLTNYRNFTPSQSHIDEIKEWLQRRHPKHSDRRPLSWYYAFLVLEVSEVTIRDYVKKGILKDLTIPSLSEFIAKRDLVWEQYGRPEDCTADCIDIRIEKLTEELNEARLKNGKEITIQEEELLKGKEDKKWVTCRYHKIDLRLIRRTYDFAREVMRGDN